MKTLFSHIPKTLSYLDPGSGSMLVQLVIGAVLGVGVLIRVFWSKIKAFFSGKTKKDVSMDEKLDPTSIDKEL